MMRRMRLSVALVTVFLVSVTLAETQKSQEEDQALTQDNALRDVLKTRVIREAEAGDGKKKFLNEKEKKKTKKDLKKKKKRQKKKDLKKKKNNKPNSSKKGKKKKDNNTQKKKNASKKRCD